MSNPAGFISPFNRPLIDKTWKKGLEMSIEGKIEVVKRAILEGEKKLKEHKDLLENYFKTVPDLEQSLESDKKRLEELVNETQG